jgi:GNAT superfamily N-acetyltransferase
MNPDDAGRWAELLAAVEEVDRRDEHHDADDCVEELADPELGLERDTIVVLDGPAGDEATAVAYQVLRLRSGRAEGAHLISDAGVHPAFRRRGIGNALLAVARERAGELGATLMMRVPETNAGAVALAEGIGMGPARWWSELHRDLTEPVTSVPAPAGLALASLGPYYDAARWDESLRAAHNSAFADHWGSVPASAEAWVHQAPEPGLPSGLLGGGEGCRRRDRGLRVQLRARRRHRAHRQARSVRRHGRHHRGAPGPRSRCGIARARVAGGP